MRDLKETGSPNIDNVRNVSGVACAGLSHFFAKKVVSCGKERVKSTLMTSVVFYMLKTKV